MFRLTIFLLRLAPLLACQACVLTPAWKQLAAEGELQSEWVQTAQFQHRVLANDVPGSHLRIYVDGDGSPWIQGSQISVDPTPSNPLLLELMHDADHPAVYLGRPCYFGSATSPGCSSRWWTFDRYSAPVVRSMCAAANAIAEARGADTVQLIGYSGGGAIVAAMIGCTDRLVSVATVAANLDPARWADYHEYTPFRDIALPATDRPGVSETHWQCRADENVPPSVTDAYFATRAQARRIIVDDCSHATGWEKYWPGIVGESSSLPRPFPEGL